MSNDLGETSTEAKLALSGAPQFTEKIEDQKTGIDAPWKIAAKVTGESRVVSQKLCPLTNQMDFFPPNHCIRLTSRIEIFTNRHQMFYIQMFSNTLYRIF